MTLSDWIAERGGRKAVAEELGVTEEAIHYWLTKQSTPRLETMVKIIKLSGGKLSIVDIIHATKPPRVFKGMKR